jgi:hypothetical protein
MDIAREQCPEVILESTILHCHQQGFTSQILLERKHRHLQRVPSWIAQLQGNVVVSLAVQEVRQSGCSREREQSIQRDRRYEAGKHDPQNTAASHERIDLRE